MFSQVLRFEHVVQFITLGMVDGVAVLVLLCFLSTGVLVNINNFAFSFRFPLSLRRKCNFDFFKATEDMKDKLTKWEGNYKDGFTESWDLITRYSPDKAGQGAALTETQTDKKWLKFSPNTVKNCGVAAFKVGFHSARC